MKRILLLLILISIQLIQGYKLLQRVNNDRVETPTEMSVDPNSMIISANSRAFVLPPLNKK